MSADSVARVVAGLLIVSAIVAYIVRLPKIEERKRLSSFRSKAQAIVTDLAFRFHESEAGMRGSVEALMDKCRCKPDEVRGDALEAYDKKDYLLFAYLSALEYSTQFSPEYVEELSAFCKEAVGRLQTRLLSTPGYELEK